jgi:hypothetical protein
MWSKYTNWEVFQLERDYQTEEAIGALGQLWNYFKRRNCIIVGRISQEKLNRRERACFDNTLFVGGSVLKDHQLAAT